MRALIIDASPAVRSFPLVELARLDATWRGAPLRFSVTTPLTTPNGNES